MNVLECSSRGDKRCSAMYVTLDFNGVKTTIENHYQNAKGFNSLVVKRKGACPDYACINGKVLHRDALATFYEYLWFKYLDYSPNLVNYLGQFDDYTDMFKSKRSYVCQADSIRRYIKQGRESIKTMPYYEEIKQLDLS